MPAVANAGSGAAAAAAAVAAIKSIVETGIAAAEAPTLTRLPAESPAPLACEDDHIRRISATTTTTVTTVSMSEYFARAAGKSGSIHASKKPRDSESPIRNVAKTSCTDRDRPPGTHGRKASTSTFSAAARSVPARPPLIRTDTRRQEPVASSPSSPYPSSRAWFLAMESLSKKASPKPLGTSEEVRAVTPAPGPRLQADQTAVPNVGKRGETAASEPSYFDLERHHQADHQVVDDFALIRVLGKGCMGKVFLARERSTERLFALKAINKTWVVAKREIRHALSEREILAKVARISHPFLIRLHRSFQSYNQLFLVLDYYGGGDIATQLARHGRFHPDRARFYTAEILLGIEELHRLGIVYRDLKPENILMGSDGHVVLTDFGLSKQLTHSDGGGSGGRTTTFCGTAEYLAPEVLRREPHSFPVDWWSLGTLLYEMLVGTTPFWAENRVQMYMRVLRDPLVFPEFVSSDARSLISRLLERDINKRLGSGPGGATELKIHQYFATLDWDDVLHKRARPPYLPTLTSAGAVDPAFSNMDPRLTPPGSLAGAHGDESVVPVLSCHEQELFADYTCDTRLPSPADAASLVSETSAATAVATNAVPKIIPGGGCTSTVVAPAAHAADGKQAIRNDSPVVISSTRGRMPFELRLPRSAVR